MRLLKHALLGAVCAASLSVSANAAVVTSSAAGGPDPGRRPEERAVIDFDPALAPGVMLSGDFRITHTSVSGVTAAPMGDTTNFLTVPSDASSGAATLNFAGWLDLRDVIGFSFYWGSIDSYNTLELLNRSGEVIASFTGDDFADPANGGQNSPLTNRRVYFDLSGADQELGALRFISTSYAFETDDFSFNPVPEPATWALMILGFGGMGAMVRRRRELGLPMA